jgi:hypothetical protein
MTLVEMGQRERGLRMIEESTAALAKTRAGSNNARRRRSSDSDRVRPRRQLRAGGSGARGGALAARNAPRRPRPDRPHRVPWPSPVRSAAGTKEALALLDEALAMRRDRPHVSQLPVAEVHTHPGSGRARRGGCSARPHRARAGHHAVVDAHARRPVPPARWRMPAWPPRHSWSGTETQHGRPPIAREPSAAEPSLRQLPLLQTTVLEAKGTSLCRSGSAARGGALLARAAASEAELFAPGSPLLGTGVAAPCRVPGGARAHR